MDGDGDGCYADDDCDDTSADAYPGGTETWHDGIDGDCSGGSDYDQDGDGADAVAYGGSDCEDMDAEINTDAVEQWYDEVDQDGSGGSDYDQDGEGQDTTTSGGGDDCNDTEAGIYTGAAEVWYDGIDEDCLGSDDYDQDADGYPVYPMGTDCVDTDPARIGGTTEVRNGVDDDCDGEVDEGVSVFGDLVLTEIMVNPTRVGDTLGEWVEVYNPGAWDIDLSGWRLAGSDGNTVTVSGTLVVPAGGYTVLGVDADTGRNGIVEMFYVSLNNDYLYTAPVTAWTGWAGRHDLYGTQEIPALTTSLVGCCTYTTEVVDLTGDGDADYVVGGYGPSGTASLNLFQGVIAGRSSGGDYDVTIGSSNATGGYPQPYVGADFNGDGVSELVVASPTSPWSSHTLAGYVGIYDLNGLRTNAVARDDADRLYYGDGNDEAVGTDVAAEDWNGDGYADLALSGNGSIWLVQGDGLATTGSAALSTAATATIDWAGATTIQVALVDDLGDGTRSLVGAADDLRRWADAGALTGASSADAADTVLTGPAGWAPLLGAAAADVDGDSIDDLLFSADADRRTMLYGYTAADWPAGTHPIGAGALGWELAEAGATWGSAYDLDGDGAEEVVLSHPGYSSVGRTWIVGF